MFIVFVEVLLLNTGRDIRKVERLEAPRDFPSSGHCIADAKPRETITLPVTEGVLMKEVRTMAVVYVLSTSGKPLMPTTRCGHVRILLKEKKARVVERNPFTIQLTYETEEVTQPLYLGIDTGRTNIGTSVVREDGKCVFTAQLTTRNKDVPKLMKERKQYRMAHRRLKRRCKRQRRAKAAGTTSPKGEFQRLLPGYEEPITCKGIKNKEARFNNRKRSAGWLTPTANHLLQTHINLVKKLQKFLPITDVVLEVNQFAFMAMDNPHIQRWQYQHGPLFGKGSVEEAVYAAQDGHCMFCEKGIDHYHHIVPRRKNGSETLENRVGLCEEHHRLVHTEDAWTKKLDAMKAGMNKKYHALSVLNQIIPALTERLAELFPQHAFVTTGQDTYRFREDHGIPKDHYLDAYCIACSALPNVRKVGLPKGKPYDIRQFRRHDRQACHKANIARKYVDADGKVVATNRHKAMEQKNASLEEYRTEFGEKAVCQLTVKPHKPAYKDMDRTMPGSIFIYEGKPFVMQSSTGRYKGNPNYFITTDGEKFGAKFCLFIKRNKGLTFAG